MIRRLEHTFARRGWQSWDCSVYKRDWLYACEGEVCVSYFPLQTHPNRMYRWRWLEPDSSQKCAVTGEATHTSCNMENSNQVLGKNILTVRVLKHWTEAQSSGVISILGDIWHSTGQNIKQPNTTWLRFILSNINYPMNTEEASAIKSHPVVLFIWMKIWHKYTGRKLWLKMVIIR